MEKIFYLAQIINGLHTFFGVVLAVGAICALLVTCATIASASDVDEARNREKELLCGYKNLRKWAVRLWTLVIASMLFVVFIPSRRTFLFMVGGRLIDEVVEHNPEVREIPGNTIDLLNEYIKAETANIKAKNTKQD